MAKQKPIKMDPQNARIHPDENKEAIKNSLKELGAGRSVLLDADNVLIAGNGVYQQAKALNIPVKIIETDGTELIAVKRKDLNSADDKRKALALADNRISDMSEFDEQQLEAMLKELEPEMQELAGFSAGEFDEQQAQAKMKTVNTRAYRKTHILLSFPPDLMLDIQEKLADIMMMEGVEIEQGSN